MAANSNINFTGNNDRGLQVGVNEGTIENNVFNPKEPIDKCLVDLRLSNPRDDKERIENTKGGLLGGSYKWILEHSDFKRWHNDDQSRLLWIKGDPGKGKTMLLIGIVNELDRELAQLKQQKQSNPPTVLTYFFCQGTDSNLNNATAVLRGLIYFLAVQQPSLTSDLRKQYENSGSKLFNDNNAFFVLSKILVDMLQDSTLSRAYIIIDALDECETDLEMLLQLVVKNTCSHRVKWIVSSRNRPDIERQLKLDNSQTKLSLELKANAEYVSNAVGNYIDHRVSQLESLKDDDGTRDQVQNVLRKKAAGTFLWVALVIQELERVEPWDVLDILKEIPTDLGDLYARMMHRIEKLERRDPEFCRLVLATSTLAYRPLHVTELGLLSGLPEKISNEVERVRKLVRMCGSLLTIRDDRVYIIHQSAKEYLMGSIASAAMLFSATGGMAETHCNISIRSLQVMMKTLRRDIYSLVHPGFSIDNLQVPSPDPLVSVRYSCLYWAEHLCEASQANGPAESGLAQAFLEYYLLYWAEALSLLGAISEAIHAMAKLERLLKHSSSDSTRLLSLTVDAHRFLTRNASVIKNSPLQTYVSALVFSPTHSLTRELFRNEEPLWVVATSDKSWGALILSIVKIELFPCGFSQVLFSPDDRMIIYPKAINFGYKIIESWDAVTGEVKDKLCVPRDGRGSDAVGFMPNGRFLVSESSNKTIKIRDAATGEVNHILEGQNQSGTTRIISIAFSPHAKLLASAYCDGMIEIWNVVTGKLKNTLKGQNDLEVSLLFSPDCNLIALRSKKVLETWDVITGKAKQTIKCQAEGTRIMSFAFSPDEGLMVLGWDDGTIELWDAKKSEAKYTLQGQNEGISSVTVSPDGTLIASGSDDGTLQVWDAATGVVKSTLNGHVGSITSVAFSSDGRLLVSNSTDHTIKVWDVTISQVHNALDNSKNGELTASIKFSPNGKLIASWLQGEKKVKILDAATGEIKETLEASCDFDGVFFYVKGLGLYGAPSSKNLLRYHWQSMDIQEEIKPRSQDEQCGFSLDEDGSWIKWNGHKVLCLPSEFQRTSRYPKKPIQIAWHSLATSNVVKLAISYGSWRVMIITLSKPPGLPSGPGPVVPCRLRLNSRNYT